jgi:CubicO group peptidase (beta-lactamase class C family)
LFSSLRTRLPAVAAIVLLSLAATAAQQQPPAVPVGPPLVTPPFEAYLELLRQQAGIPGLSAAIVQNGEIVWERGMGFQNVDARIRATPDSPYLIGDLSESFAAVLLLECLESRQLGLDDQLAGYGAAIDPGVTVRQVLTHTAASPTGEIFRFDPARFALLTPAVERCVPQPYRKTVAVQLLERLAMKDSVPGRDVLDPQVVETNVFAEAIRERYRAVLERLAVPYKVDRRGRPTRTELPVDGLNAAGGLVSTVRDLARFDAALSSGLLLREETLAGAWSNPFGREKALPFGQGWFVQRYGLEPVVWHFGLVANGYSSLFLKLPNRHLTLILLANSDGLSAPFDLQSGDVTKSVFANLFLRLFA